MAKKGTVAIFGNNDFLYDFYVDHPIEVTNKALAESIQLDLSYKAYGLKITSNKNAYHNGNYLTEENKYLIENGFKLSLEFSAEYMVENIFKIIDHERAVAFSHINNLATDPAFIKALVAKGKYEAILNMMHAQSLTGSEAAGCFVLLLHLLKLKVVGDVPYDQLSYIIRFAKVDTNIQELHLAYAVLIQILYQKSNSFNRHKEKIINDLEITPLLAKIKTHKHNKKLDGSTLQLINAMVRAVQGDMKTHMIKEMKKKENRDVIYTHIIGKDDISNNIAHELYVYQTYILSLYKESLNPVMDIENENIKDLLESETVVPRCSTLLDFDNSFIVKRSTSQDTILSNDDNRMSLASLQSVRTMKSLGSFYLSDGIVDDIKICHLTVECLSHYKRHYSKNFYQSQTEENTYQPGILKSGERVTHLLAKVLKIGREPNRFSENYQPLVYNPSFQYDFFPELFCRVMWLLSKTRREMKASIYDDYDKVLKILRKQMEIVLNEKYKCYNELLEKMKRTGYGVVSLELEKEYHKDLNKLLDTNPCIQELKEKYRKQNEDLILQQKIKLLQKGTCFSKYMTEKKKDQTIYMQLLKNKKIVQWYEYDKTLENPLGPKHTFNVSDITFIVFGKSCPHVKDGRVKKHTQAISVYLDSTLPGYQEKENAVINLFASNEKITNHWIDGFNLLKGKNDRTSTYERDIRSLVEMDCLLQLMELQNVKIPSCPPPVPKPPTSLKPSIPPRSPILLAKLKEHQERCKSNTLQLAECPGDSTI